MDVRTSISAYDNHRRGYLNPEPGMGGTDLAEGVE